jgi:hypothetical protein
VTGSWVRELSDDELETRLRTAGVEEADAARLVTYRDSEHVVTFLHDILDPDP